MRVRLPHYYIKALREFWKQGILTEAEVREKDVLVIGLSYFGTGVIAALQEPFLSRGARVDYVPLFNENFGISSSLPEVADVM